MSASWVRLTGQGSRDTIEQSLANLGQGLVDGVGGAPELRRGGLGGGPCGKPPGQQVAVGRAEFLDAVGQRLAAILQLECVGVLAGGFREPFKRGLAE